jgi:hypothetical protein
MFSWKGDGRVSPSARFSLGIEAISSGFYPEQEMVVISQHPLSEATSMANIS